MTYFFRERLCLPPGNYSIIFEAVQGFQYASDIAIDDIRLIKGCRRVRDLDDLDPLAGKVWNYFVFFRLPRQCFRTYLPEESTLTDLNMCK